MSLFESEYFELLNWLEVSKKMKRKSARDVISRAHRASKHIDLFSPIADEMIIYNLNKTKFMTEMKGSVPSQIRRAVMLCREYIKY